MPDLPGAVDDRNPELMKPNEVPPGPWDPGLLKDDDGRWYLYWGSSNLFPIYGIEIAWQGDKLIYKGEPTKLFLLHPDQHGWERFGQDHNGLLANGQPSPPYVEGAWMTKHGGRYYLQYGAPGTEFNVYGNGTYVGDKPLGPFKYADYNPIAYKPGGFVHGAGHGSTFEDVHGNWWNTGTPWIGYNWTFERRINMFPAKFEADGQFWSSSRFGDFPQYMPTTKVADPNNLFTGWMLLSYRKAATASSTMGEFGADRVTDENPRTFWVAAANKPGETLTRRSRTRRRRCARCRSISPTTSPAVSAMRRTSTRSSSCRVRSTARRWQPLARTEPPRRDRPERVFRAAAAGSRAVHPLRPRPCRRGQPRDQRHPRVRECRRAGACGAVTHRGRRHPDQRDATIRWAKVPGAVGYNIRFGIRPDRLTLTHQLWADELGNGETSRRNCAR